MEEAKKELDKLLMEDVVKHNIDVLTEFSYFEAKTFLAGGNSNSLAVLIPNHIIKNRGIRKGDEVALVVRGKPKVV